MEHHKLGRRSLKELYSVHPDLVSVVELALKYSKYDFGITQGIRTEEEQRENIAKGVSWTMDSLHFIQPDGYVHAIDFMVYVNGKGTWEVGYYRKVMQAFVRAAIELGVQVRFGGLWRTTVDVPHVELAFYK